MWGGFESRSLVHAPDHLLACSYSPTPLGRSFRVLVRVLFPPRFVSRPRIPALPYPVAHWSVRAVGGYVPFPPRDVISTIRGFVIPDRLIVIIIHSPRRSFVQSCIMLSIERVARPAVDVRCYTRIARARLPLLRPLPPPRRCGARRQRAVMPAARWRWRCRTTRRVPSSSRGRERRKARRTRRSRWHRASWPC